MKISVETKALLEKAEMYLANLKKENEEAQKVRDKKEQDLRKQASKALREAAELLDRGGEVSFDELDGVSVQSGKLRVSVDIKAFSPELRDTYRVERDVEALKNCSKSSLSVGPEDHLYRYLASPEKANTRGGW